MKIAELCSQNNVKDGNLYDVKNSNSEYYMNEVGYMGIQCDCMGVKNPENCKHANVVSDFGLINFYLNLLNSNTR